jgi:hypothetical protein
MTVHSGVPSGLMSIVAPLQPVQNDLTRAECLVMLNDT